MKKPKGESLGEPPLEIEKLASFFVEGSYVPSSISSNPSNHAYSES